MGLIDIDTELIPFIEKFGFDVQVSKLEDTNKAITPKPFIRFMYRGEDYEGTKIPLVIYRDDDFDEVCEKLREALIKVGTINRNVEIKNMLFND